MWRGGRDRKPLIYKARPYFSPNHQRRTVIWKRQRLLWKLDPFFSLPVPLYDILNNTLSILFYRTGRTVFFLKNCICAVWCNISAWRGNAAPEESKSNSSLWRSRFQDWVISHPTRRHSWRVITGLLTDIDIARYLVRIWTKTWRNSLGNLLQMLPETKVPTNAR